MNISPSGIYVLSVEQINDNGMDIAIFVNKVGRFHYRYYLPTKTGYLEIDLSC